MATLGGLRHLGCRAGTMLLAVLGGTEAYQGAEGELGLNANDDLAHAYHYLDFHQ